MEEGEGNSKTFDRSGRGNTGTLTNMDPTTDWVNSATSTGQALDFDGSDDQVDVNKSTSLDVGNTFTISAWIYSRDAMTTNRKSVYSTRRNNPTGSWQFEAGGNMGTGANIDNSFGITGVNSWVAVANPGFISPNRWNHIVATKNGTASTDTKLYINGTEVSYSERNAYTITDNTDQPVIGEGTSNGQNFDGLIDEVRIYNRALSAEEVKRLYNLKKPKVVSGVDNTGLVGYWAFEDGVGTYADDSSFNENRGALSGMDNSDWVTGRVGKALDFDGSNDYITAPDNDSLDSTSDLTISAWVKADNWTGEGGAGVAISTLVKKDSNYILRKDDYAIYGGTGLKMYWWDGTNLDVHIVSTPSVGVWHHIVGVNENNTTRKIYIDGVLQSGTDDLNNTGTRALTNILEIGSGASASESFDGQIDDVRIYNRALSASEIKALYEGSRASVVNKTKTDRLTNGLVGHWTFDGKDIYGTTALDKTSNNNRGTLTNGPAVTLGKIGQALDFVSASTQYVSLGTGINPNAVTYSAWIKATSFPNAYNTIISRSNGSTVYSQYFIKSTGKVAVFVRSGGGSDISYNGTGSNTLTAGNWYHVAFTYDSTSGLKGYVNGSIDGTAAANGAISITATNIRIGSDPGIASREWNGIIDDVRIYNRALSADEVYQLYNMGR